MNRFITIALLGACLLSGDLLFNPLDVAAGDKPLLSVAIRKAIDTKGVEAAKKQFAKEYARNKNQYQVDMPNVTALMNAYVGARNSLAANAVLTIANPYIYDVTMAARNAQVTQRATQHKALSEKTRTMQKVRIKEYQEAQKKQAAEKKAADDQRVARYEAQRKPVISKPGAAPAKLTSEDKWYLVRTLNVDAKGVSIMKPPAALHQAALAAGFKGRMSGTGSDYTKGPIRLTAYFYPDRNRVEKMSYNLRDLPPAQWEAFVKKIMRQLGSVGPPCIRRSGTRARLKCSIHYSASAHYYARVEIRGTLRQDKGSIKLVFHQGSGIDTGSEPVTRAE